LSYLATVATVAAAFGLTFLGELPDKSLFASLVLGTRYRPAHVWAGAADAFAVQMAIAVTAGRLLSLLPHHLVDGIVAVLFLAGSAYLWVTSFRPQHPEGMDAARQGSPPASFLRIAGTSFGVVFLAEWGDITQLTAANLAARSNPMAWVRRITATILLAPRRLHRAHCPDRLRGSEPNGPCPARRVAGIDR
jgi:putative Ca2+/H+ antiporter (TMEM165/GDT1 family)